MKRKYDEVTQSISWYGMPTVSCGEETEESDESDEREESTDWPEPAYAWAWDRPHRTCLG